jgi:hypothetical protein
MYENQTMKPVEIVLRRGERGMGRMMEDVNVVVYPPCITIIC